MQPKYLNMDLVRYVLSIAVIIAHFNQMMGAHIPYPITSHTAVGVFFGLSGYLVYGSFLKHNNLRKYIIGRAKRILPPYLFIVVLCAFGLACVSDLTLSEYLTDGGLWKYLAANICFLNFLHPDLPGVFTDSSINAVNASLWTLKIEWALYLSIPLFFWGVRKYKWHVPTSIIIICLLSFIYSFVMTTISEASGNHTYYKLSYQFIGQLAYFYTGVLVYHYKDKLIGKRWTYTLLIAVCVYAVIENNIFNLQLSTFNLKLSTLNLQLSTFNFQLMEIGGVFLVFTTLLFSLSKDISRHTAILGNVSYEMYLFHFPVIQLALHFNINTYFSQPVCCLIILTAVILLSVAFQKSYKKIVLPVINPRA